MTEDLSPAAVVETEERYRSVARQSDREAVLQAVFDAVAGALTLLCVEGTGRYRIEEVNPFLLRAYGAEREELVGLVVDRGTPAAGAIIDLVDRVVAGGETISAEVETAYMRAYRWAMVSASPIKDASGAVRRVLLVSVPIDDRKRVEEALQASGEHYRALLEGQPDAIYRVRRDGAVIDAHVPMNGASGTVSRFTGVTLPDVLPAGAAAQLLPLVARAIDEGTPQRLEAGGGSTPARALECRLVRSGADEVTLIVRDITDARAMEQRLAVTERMASLCRLSEGVAHEINNPLAFVTGNQAIALALVTEALETLRSSSNATLAVPQLERALAALHDAEEGARRVQHTIKDLQIFSRPDDERRGPVALRQVVESTLHIANNTLRQRARVETALGDVPAVNGTEARLAQLVLNLLMNAADAVGENAKDATIAVSLRAEGSRVVLTVEDSGVGIAPEALPRVFEPFFTTKPVGKGSGLGLSLCHGIVTALGGEIRIASTVGVGTTVTVSLPPADAPAEKVSAPAPPGAPTRRARVLVIDDEPLVGKMLARVMEKSHDVTVTSCGRDALDLIARGTQFDIVFCDLMMPEMTGMDVYETVLAKDPELARRIVFMTGGAFTAAARHFLEHVAHGYVQKPFDGSAIDHALRRVLDAG